MKYLIQPWAKHLLATFIVIVILGFTNNNLFSQTHTFITKTIEKDIVKGNNRVIVKIQNLELGIYQVIVSNNSDRFVERLIKL